MRKRLRGRLRVLEKQNSTNKADIKKRFIIGANDKKILDDEPFSGGGHLRYNGGGGGI